MVKKEKYQIEFPFQASSHSLFLYLSVPAKLGEWFADEVTLKGNTYTFKWGETEETATLITKKEDHFVKYRWEEDEEEDTFFELKMEIDEITKDVSLIITDFAEPENIEDEKLLWEQQIKQLHNIIGR